MATANGYSNKKKDYRLRRQKRQQIRQLIDAIDKNDVNTVFHITNSVLDINFPYRRKTPLEVAVEHGHMQICCLLLRKGADVNRCNQGLNNLLNIACQKGFLKVAEVLIMNSADIDSRNEHGATPLHSAVMNGFVKIVTMLLNNGCDVNMPNDQLETPLLTAVRANDLTMANLLLDHECMVDGPNGQMNTPLMVAAGCGYLDIVNRLLKGGAEITKKDRTGCTALFYAVSEGYRDVVETLLKAGSDPDIRTLKKLTCLTEAIRKNHIDVAFCLLDFGCNVDLCDRQGVSPILTAISQLTVYFSQQENPRLLVNRLLELKCDVNLADSSGTRPLHQSAMGGDYDLCKQLVEHGADIHAADNNGDSVLHAAAYGNSFELVKYFVELGCDINKSNNKGETVLWPVISSSDYETTEYLVEHGAYVNAVEKCERTTTIHVAIAAHNTKAVKLLIDSGCGLNRVNINGQTPLLMASEKGYDEIVEMLLAQPKLNKRCLGSIAPVHAAVEYGHLTVAQKLIEGGWNCNQVNTIGITPIQMACSLDAVNMVKLLLLFGCDLRAHTKYNEMYYPHIIEDEQVLYSHEPVFLATTNQNVDLVKLILKCSLHLHYRLLRNIETLLERSRDMHALVRRENRVKIIDILQKARQNPRSLMEICRVVIREQLQANPRTKLDTISYLAPSQKDYICMVDELKIESPHIHHVNWS